MKKLSFAIASILSFQSIFAFDPMGHIYEKDLKPIIGILQISTACTLLAGGSYLRRTASYALPVKIRLPFMIALGLSSGFLIGSGVQKLKSV